MLNTKALVLVTNQNQLLDILTAEQQQHIQQRITWEVAHYLRYLGMRQQVAGLPPLRVPNDRSQMWTPIRAFHRLMVWMQSGSIAIATNLFQEASLPASPTPVANLPAADQPPALSAAPLTSIKRLRDHLIAALAPSTNSGAINGGAIAQPAGATHPNSGSLAIATGSADLAALASGISSRPMSPIQGNGTMKQGLTENGERSSNYIDTDATFMGYEQSLLERILRWLDRGLLWVEELLVALWSKLLKLFQF
ncbi:MAG: hypothetical protein HC866_22070 [Leptolyngbyaceae cyanobacterium RU_5_1]|nr:hypothetical protein [Leptolyngbyaceae cyanobacterium RU_5_1]